MGNACQLEGAVVAHPGGSYTWVATAKVSKPQDVEGIEAHAEGVCRSYYAHQERMMVSGPNGTTSQMQVVIDTDDTSLMKVKPQVAVRPNGPKPGVYQYDFKFDIPADCPASFDIHKRPVVFYEVKFKIKMKGTFSSNIKGKKKITVVPRPPPAANATPLHVKLLDDNTSIDMPPVWYRGSPVTGKLGISDASIQKYAKMIVQLKYGGRFYVGGRAQSIHGAITQNEMYNAVKSEFKMPPAGSTGPNGFTNLDFTINLPGTIPISISNMRVLVYYKMKVTLVTRPGRGDNHVQKIDVTVA